MVLKHVRRIWKSESLRKKILFTLGILVVYKFLSVIPVPGTNLEAMDALRNLMDANQWLAFFSALMGGGLEQFSIILMGLAPYINALIIIQLLTVVIPKLEAIKKEGSIGQKKINQYTRYLTVPLALAQSYGMILLINTILPVPIFDTNNFFWTVLPAMIIITSGTVLLMWLWELINEKGIGNGISIVIFAGVLSGVPGFIQGYIQAQNYITLIGLFLATLAVIYIIIKFTEGYRRVPLVYTRTGREERSYFPIRVNQAGMIPIIFAVSVVTFPSLIGKVLQAKMTWFWAEVGQFLVTHMDMQNPSWLYIIIYFLLVLGFSFFYVSITFNTEEIAESIQKQGGYIPWVRPGSETALYLQNVSSHLNLYGWGFLALIAVFPYIMAKTNMYLGTPINLSWGRLDFIINAAGLIIVVGVILDLVRRVDTELKSFDYKKFY